MITKYYNNFVKYDYFDKYCNLKKNSYFSKKLEILVTLQLRFIKKENDARILDTLLFLEILTGSKFFIKKFSFFFSKILRSNYSELFICCFIKRNHIFSFMKFLNKYFVSFYKKYILKNPMWIHNNGVDLMSISRLNKLFSFNKSFKRQDICNIIFLENFSNKQIDIGYSKVSFLIDKN